MKDYHYYLFDADGTLFDTADLICDCFQYVAHKHGCPPLSRDTILAGYGLPLKGQLAKQLGNVDLDTVLADYMEYQLAILKERVFPFPEVSATLAGLHQRGKKLAIVTSRRRHSMEIILESTGTGQYFDAVVTPEDTTLHKPDAEPALHAISLLGADKADTTFIGDARFDIMSGTSAGIDTVFVNWSHADKTSLPVPPTWTIDSLGELLI